MDLESLAALRTPAGAALLAQIGPYDQELALPLGARLRAQQPVNPALVATAMTQPRNGTRMSEPTFTMIAALRIWASP